MSTVLRAIVHCIEQEYVRLRSWPLAWLVKARDCMQLRDYIECRIRLLHHGSVDKPATLFSPTDSVAQVKLEAYCTSCCLH
jgi:hypothetical protein